MIKRSSFNKILVSALIIIVVAISPTKIASSEKDLYDDIKYPSVFELTNDDKTWIENKLKEMSLDDKCAQMIMPAVYREDIDTSSDGYKKIKALVKDRKIGGLILFQSGLIEQASFINEIQATADIPLLISSDYERGLGTRVDNATEFPHAMALGSTHNSSFAFEMGKAIAMECRIFGVHWNFAPVADINNNPLNPVINIRAFSEDLNEVSEFVKAFIDGSKNTRILTSAKHFPGHGNTEIDSHYDLPRINGDADYLKSNELKPFQEAIDAGVHSIMIGHLEVPSLDPIPGTPSTLSKPIITQLLKNEMGFDGLIITDAMNMEGVTKYYSSEDAAVLAVIAGIDVILMPPDAGTAINALKSAVMSGKISIERIDESVRKILAAKRWLNIEHNKFSDINTIQKSLIIKEHFLLSKKIAEESTTLLKNDSSLIPLDYSKFQKIYCITLTDGEGAEKSQLFKSLVESRLENITSELLTKTSNKNDYNRVLDSLINADLIILPAFIDVKTYQDPI
ncbi:MAG TPA: glycoside hydrolase family 3 N-terminal domain-containing protein, partial [Ignavibacteriaceae bacterium]|nr:glycoside hydrolase family 3 N-terminal domain-containing protein [Ignavibacteriaceae bacterium]